MGVRAGRWSLGALVVGSVIVADPTGLAPFGPAKWLTISTLGALGGGLSLWTGSRPLHRRSLVLWAVLLVALSLGALFGGDLPTALLGQPDRHLGLITWLLFFLLFCAGQQVDEDDLRSLVRAVVVATLLLGTWAVWERVVGAPIDIETNTSRLTGPFGSASYLGAAACLLVPISAGGALDRTTPKWWRVTAVASTALGTFALVGSGARAAWVATAVVIAVVIVVVRPPRRALAAGAVAMTAVIALSAPQLGDIADRSGSAASRFDEWAVAARVLGDHPLVGVGPEGYRIAVSEGIDRHYERTYGRDRVLPDRAHNGPLDVALAGGVVAAIASCLLIGFVCWRALHLMRAAAGATMAGVGAGVVAYALQQLVLFPLAEIDPIWWLVAGAVVSSAPSAAASPVVLRCRRWTAVAAFVAAPVALIAGTLDVAANRLAKNALNEDDSAQAITDAERAVTLRPDNTGYRMVAAEVLSRRGTLADIDAAIRQTEHALTWSEDDPIALDRHASLLLDRAGATRSDADIRSAVVAWTALVDRDPVRARWQLQLGRAAALAGDDDLAKTAWTAAADLAPGDPTPIRLLDALEAQ
jgi:hypothetical protein